MSSRARRFEGRDVEAFTWHATPAGPAGRRREAAGAHEGGPAAGSLAPDTEAEAARLAAHERDAFSKGFAQGERAGNEAAARRGEAMIRRLAETLEELAALREQMIHQTERQMVQLALAIARRVVQREISLDQDLLIAMARVALDRLGEDARVTVRLNPEDFEATAAVRSAEWPSGHVTVAADARVGRGGCRVESELGAVDAGVEAQIQEIARALLGESATEASRVLS